MDLGNTRRVERKRERNRRRRRSIRTRRKEIVTNALSFRKELENKEVELAQTKLKLMQTRKRVLELSKPPSLKLRIVSTNFRARLQSQPTASSSFNTRSSYRGLRHADLEKLVCEVNQIDQHSLKYPYGSVSCDIGSGAFGKCIKMLLCSTEVAVKMTTVNEYSCDNILYEAKVMTHVCRGHPNLPLFIGVYNHKEYPKPLLVMKYYSVDGRASTFHNYLRSQHKTLSNKSLKDWAIILRGICNGLDAIHQKFYLHNDLKCDNVVLSDCIPSCDIAPTVWPIIIDFGKARSVQFPKTYKLTGKERTEYLQKYVHLAPELVSGEYPQSTSTDIYSLGQIIKKVAVVTRSSEFKGIAKACLATHAIRPSIAFVRDALRQLVFQ